RLTAKRRFQNQMAVLTFPKSMLYCPKCQASYEEGTQRFCSGDGVRLLSSTGKPAGQTKSVFANALKKSNWNAEKNSTANLFNTESKPRVFNTPITAESFRSIAQENLLNISFKSENPAKPEKSEPRLIKPNEISVSRAKLGDRSQNPPGRQALTWENTAILLGQTVKGRYYITRQLSEDETSVAYLAEDKIVSDRKVVVRVLMDEKQFNDFERKIFAEERVSLSHINHPNVAHLFDSGELLEGKDFIVSEYVEGVSLRDKLSASGQFNTNRAAKIIRQAADALGEVHANGILHRNLKPENLILTVSQTGNELVKVTDFAVFDGLDEPTEESLKYLAPEHLEGRVPNFAGDIYSLAVIAFQMLTGRVPFNFAGEKEMLKAQKSGLSIHPSNLRMNLSPQTDEVLQKALAYNPSERYSKARDFGEALYYALNVQASPEKTSEDFIPAIEESILEIEEVLDQEAGNYFEIESGHKESEIEVETAEETVEEKPEIIRGKILPVETLKQDAEVFSDKLPPIVEETNKYFEEEKVEIENTPEETPAEIISPAPIKAATSSRALFLTAVVLLLGIVGIAGWIFMPKFSKVPAENQTTPVVKPQAENIPAAVPEPANSGTVKSEDVESPPPTRRLTAPPNSLYYQNSKEKFKGDLAKNYRGFSFYYPNDWEKNPGGTNFVDVARIGATGTPIEQFLVSSYDSKGTFAADREIFPELADESGKDLEKALNGKFNLLSQGETKINGEWKAYEIKFQGEGVTVNGDRITLWGRRLWIPAARAGIGTGFVVTMLATSISPEVQSADDVGIKGELAQVLATFEPDALDKAR
ncbi:MAG: serine/threonine protein kinase, partial [Pyrinomonadaceae bacterium]